MLDQLLPLLALVLLMLIVAVYGSLEICQENCISADRLVGTHSLTYFLTQYLIIYFLTSLFRSDKNASNS